MGTERVTAHPYFGKMMCCHSQAVLMAFGDKRIDAADVLWFEIATTVPFGLRTVTNDATRVLSCWLDPDQGIERALESLGMHHETWSWPTGSDPDGPLTQLRRLLKTGHVVIGPVDLGRLKHVGLPHLYAGCDHYAVVWGEDGSDGFAIGDPEGYPLVYVSTSDIIDAWRGDAIPEGRGSFVMRQVHQTLTPAASFDSEVASSTMRLALQNLTKCRRSSDCGANAFRLLANRSTTLMASPSFRNGLVFALSVRKQRLALIEALLRRVELEPMIPLVRRQTSVVSDALADITAGVSTALEHLQFAADTEDELLAEMEQVS